MSIYLCQAYRHCGSLDSHFDIEHVLGFPINKAKRVGEELEIGHAAILLRMTDEERSDVSVEMRLSRLLGSYKAPICQIERVDALP